MPGLDWVGRGVYLRPDQAPQLRDVIFPRDQEKLYFSNETGVNYSVPIGYEVNDSPPMPANQALNQTIIEESWERFEKRTSLEAAVAVGSGPFSVDVNASQTSQIRQDEESYYALRTSFIPLYSIYIANSTTIPDEFFEGQFPVPFDPKHRRAYERFFHRYGTHFVSRAWVGGKSNLALTISKSCNMSKSEIQAGLKASMIGTGSGSVSASDQEAMERLQNNSQCIVVGKGGDEMKLASLSTLDNTLYNGWLLSVKDNPQVIEYEVQGIWTLLRDEARANALARAYCEETLTSPIRVAFNLDGKIHFFGDLHTFTYDIAQAKTSAPMRIDAEWPDLFQVGFDHVDAAFLGRELMSAEGEDLSRKLYMFNRDKYLRWDVDRHAIDPGYPHRIADGFPGVDFPRIDAAVNVRPDSLYLFCGPEYVRFNTLVNHIDDGYPDLIARRWAGVTFDRIDCATYWGNGKIYFFRDDKFIRYDIVMCRTDAGFPKRMTGHYVEDWRFFE